MTEEEKQLKQDEKIEEHIEEESEEEKVVGDDFEKKKEEEKEPEKEEKEEPKEEENEKSESTPSDSESKELKEEKSEPEASQPFPKDKQAKEGSFKPLVIIMLISLAIAGFWNTFPVIKNSIHAILNPSAGALLDWNVTWGMIILVAIITFIMTLAQKHLTDQDTLREMKKEQKELSEKMKKLERGSKEQMELTKKQFEVMPQMMKLSMRPMAYTGVPIILFFRWFMDYFNAIPDFRFFGFFTWFWFYLIASIIISSILRKYMKVV